MAFELIDGACTAPEVAPHVPCCGVVAIANFAGVTFSAAWAACLPHVARPGRWKGSTYDWQRRKALKALGVEWSEKDYSAMNMTVGTFVECYARPDVHYKVHMRGHVVTVFGGIVTDQCGSFPAAEQRNRRRHITSVWTRTNV